MPRVPSYPDHIHYVHVSVSKGSLQTDYVARDEPSNWGTNSQPTRTDEESRPVRLKTALRAQATPSRVYSDTPLRYAPGSVISRPYPQFPCIPVSISTVSKCPHPRGRYV
ncbi:hypothetical protein Pyn_15013 [Prunus yedoensis var. nudiflora]|uniref:Uncharacterized protein n=1 Tax=Prunus yedoensis var. nudiflora TaxID=2094558 RepID=A0A314XQF2_PRUYE|nr:hypothetical protein Pyn_15013 [Prunus yedoensis var. nudiflora]